MTPSHTKLLEDLRSGAVRLVPGEATPEMIDAGCKAETAHAWGPKTTPHGAGEYCDDPDSVYAAMLSASPDLTPALVEMIEGLVREVEKWRKSDEVWGEATAHLVECSFKAEKYDAAEARALTAEARLTDALTNLDALSSDARDTREMIVEANAKRRAAEAERDALREALAPMAAVASDIPDDWSDGHQCVTACGHFRRAARALAKEKTDDGE